MAVERILVVDDEPGVRTALEAILTDEGFQVRCVDTGETGLEKLEQEPFDAVLLDVWLPGIDGLDTLKRIRERRFDTEVVMISGHGTVETAVRATKLGAFDFVEKPLSLEKTLLVLRNALRQRRLERTNVQLLEQLSRDTEILGRSSAMERIRREVEVAAESEAAVLILGDQGGGRETIARRIHAAGGHPDAPFVEVPCAALSPAAAEAALYGDSARPGRIELAAGGTLFLEDVDRLESSLQRRLAASLVVAQRETAGPRLVASVGPDAAGLDRELRTRLEVLRIEVPGLRERREDIPLLAERFMRELSREYGREAKQLAPDSLAALQAHDWPGNVSELRNLMERLLLFAPSEVVGIADLPEQLGGQRKPLEDLYREFGSLDEGLKAFARYYISKVISEHGDDLGAAAKRLGISKPALRKRLAELEA